MRRSTRCLTIAVLLLGLAAGGLWRRNVSLRDERNRHRGNAEALMTDLRRMQVDSATMALDVSALRLTVDEYERLRAADAEKIRRLGAKIRNLEAAARHRIVVAGPIDASVADTVLLRDTVPVLRQKVEMITPHIRLTGLIEEGRLRGEIRLPVTLHQAVWIEYKGWWLWRRVKAVRQTISSDNPYAEIVYSEYISVENGRRRKR